MMTYEDAERILCNQCIHNVHCMMHDKECKPMETLKRSQWIPVSERLPDCYEPVLAIAWDEAENGWYYYVATYHDEDGFITDSTYVELNFEEPFAWMPLPEPYKEGEE